MSIATSKIREKLKKLQQAGQSKGKDLWRPESGKTVVRIVTNKKDPEWPFQEMYMHYQFGKKTYCSPVTVGDPDPIMEFAEELQSDGTREEWIQGKKLEPKLRVFVPIIVRGKESEGVKLWGFGKRVYEELLTLFDDEDYGDLSHETTGRDITIEYKTKEETKKTYGEIFIRPKPNQTPMLSEANAGLKNKVLNEQPDIFDIYEVASYDDLNAVLVRYLNPGEEDEAEENVTKQAPEQKDEPAPVAESAPPTNTEPAAETETQEPNTMQAPETKEEPATESADTPVAVAAAFDDLFGKK